MILNFLVHKQIENNKFNILSFMCSLATRQTFFPFQCLMRSISLIASSILDLSIPISDNQLFIINGKILIFFLKWFLASNYTGFLTWLDR